MRLVISFLLLLPVIGFAQQKGYTVHGEVKGARDGSKVYLEERSFTGQGKKDSTTIRNEKFTFKGHLDIPHYYTVLIDNTPAGEKSNMRNWLRSGFYLENSDISFKGNIDSLPTYFYKRGAVTSGPFINGSKTQEESQKYLASVSPYSRELTKVMEQYIQEYHLPALEGVFHTEKGIEIANKEDQLNRIIDSMRLAFIKNNPASVVAYDLAYEIVAGMFVTSTVQEIDQLVADLRKGWEGTPMMAAFVEKAEGAKKTAIGTKYQDFQFLTPDGKKVMLSQYVPEGKVVMLEFWASWCGPCRGEIPHLKHLDKEKKDLFSIVSISLDEQDDQWKKALKEEQMDWPQLVDHAGFEGEIAKSYNILGIPHSIILDKNGKILKVGLRGAYLDAFLEKMEKMQ